MIKVISKNPKKVLKPKNFKFNLKFKISGFKENLNQQKKLIILADKCLNHSNLKLTFLSVVINDVNFGKSLDNILVPFYQKLPRNRSMLLQGMKLKLKLLLVSDYMKPSYVRYLKVWDAIKSSFYKLPNLKRLHLGIPITNDHTLLQINSLNELYSSIGLNLQNLLVFKLNLYSENFSNETYNRLKLNWESMKTLKNLEIFVVKLKGYNGISSKLDIANLMKILEWNPKLKKFHMFIDDGNKLNDPLLPFQNISKYFQRLNLLQSLKLTMPIKNQRFINSEEFIKVLHICPNLRNIHLRCGDNSFVFQDKVGKIFKGLGDLMQLQKLRITYEFENQNNLIQLANSLSKMQKLQKLKLFMRYKGQKPYIFNDFIFSIPISTHSLKYLLIIIESKTARISSIFWKSLANLIASHTLETLRFILYINHIDMTNNYDEMITFADKLSQNINLSTLKLVFKTTYTHDATEFIHIIRSLKPLKYLTNLLLSHENVDNLNPDYFHILHNSLKGKPIKYLHISINSGLNRCIFSSYILDDIMKLLNNKNTLMTINDVYIRMPIYSIAKTRKKRLLDILNFNQIHGINIILEEYDLLSKQIYNTHIDCYNPDTNKSCYQLERVKVGKLSNHRISSSSSSSSSRRYGYDVHNMDGKKNNERYSLLIWYLVFGLVVILIIIMIIMSIFMRCEFVFMNG